MSDREVEYENIAEVNLDVDGKTVVDHPVQGGFRISSYRAISGGVETFRGTTVAMWNLTATKNFANKVLTIKVGAEAALANTVNIAQAMNAEHFAA